MYNKIFKIASLIALAIIMSACNGNEAKPANITQGNPTYLQKIIEKGELVLGTSGTMTPMTCSINSGKDAVGFDVDLAKAMAATMNVELVIKVIEFEKLIPALQNGEVDVVISNMTITPKRNTQVAFVGPYVTSGKCLITKEASLATAKKEELNSASHKIVVLKGTTTEAFIKFAMPNVERVSVVSQDVAVAMVRDGKVVAMMSEYPMCKSIITSNPNDDFIAAFSNLTYEPIGIAIAPQNVHLQNWTQNFMLRANNAGLFKLLSEKWFK